MTDDEATKLALEYALVDNDRFAEMSDHLEELKELLQCLAEVSGPANGRTLRQRRSDVAAKIRECCTETVRIYDEEISIVGKTAASKLPVFVQRLELLRKGRRFGLGAVN